MWTYEPRQGRNAATAVCSASAVVTLAFLIYDFGFAIYEAIQEVKMWQEVAANFILAIPDFQTKFQFDLQRVNRIS